jgi:hypothetical protein
VQSAAGDARIVAHLVRFPAKFASPFVLPPSADPGRL